MVKVRNVRVETEKNRFLVTCNDSDGRVYTHERMFATRQAADRLADRVKVRGDIGAAYWDCYTPYGTDAWLLDDMEVTLMDDEERHAKGM